MLKLFSQTLIVFFTLKRLFAEIFPEEIEKYI